MRILFVLLIVCVVAAQGYRKKKGDAFCNPNITLADAIEYEYLVFNKAVTKVNESVYDTTPLTLSKFDQIIAEKLAILETSTVEISAAASSLYAELGPFIENPEVPDASTYKAALQALIDHLMVLIEMGKTEIAAPYEDFKSNYSIVSLGLGNALIGNLETTFTDIVGKITDGNTTCACKSLRHFNKVTLNLVDAAIECGTENIADLIKHSKIINKILIAGKLTFLSFIQDGKDCLLNVVRKSNGETKSMLNSCLKIQSQAIADYKSMYDVYANSKFTVSATKTVLLKNKFYRCMESVGFEFFSLYTYFQNKYNECRGVSAEATSVSISANLLDLLNLNVSAGLGLGNLLGK